MAKSPSKARAKPRTSPRAPLLEWITAGVGLVFVLVALGLILAEVLAGPAAPADVGHSRHGARELAGGKGAAAVSATSSIRISADSVLVVFLLL